MKYLTPRLYNVFARPTIDWLTLHYDQWRTRDVQETHQFDDVEAFVLFVGYPRSGYSLVGALLDAHPEIIIADELDAIRYFELGFSEAQLLYLLLKNSQAYLDVNRNRSDDDYKVPEQWQGRYQKLRIIGDNKGGKTTYYFQKNPALLSQFLAHISVPVNYA